MPFDLSEAIESLQSGLDIVPAAVAAVILLAGPTTAWIIYRVVVVPRTSRYTEEGGGLLWMCIQCRSANEVRDSRCYRCGLERTSIAGDLHIVDGDEIVALTPDMPPPARAPVPVMMDTEIHTAPEAEPFILAASRPIRMVGPADGTPAATSPAATPRRIVVAGPGRTAPDEDVPMVAVGPGRTEAAVGKATSPES